MLRIELFFFFFFSPTGRNSMIPWEWNVYLITSLHIFAIKLDFLQVVRHLIRTISRFVIFQVFHFLFSFSYLLQDPSFHLKLLLTYVVSWLIWKEKEIHWFLIRSSWSRKFVLSRIYSYQILFYLLIILRFSSLILENITFRISILKRNQFQSIVYPLTIIPYPIHSNNLHLHLFFKKFPYFLENLHPSKIPSFPTKNSSNFTLRDR